jgi:hypothetical protein
MASEQAGIHRRPVIENNFEDHDHSKGKDNGAPVVPALHTDDPGLAWLIHRREYYILIYIPTNRQFSTKQL